MTRPIAAEARDHGRGIRRAVTAVGLAGLIVVTLAKPGATRMYAWPWSIAYVAALCAPVVLLVFRAFDRSRPLRLPSGLWGLASMLGAIIIVCSAALSPHRTPSLWWSATPLAGFATFLVLVDWLHARADDEPSQRRTLWRTLLGVFGLAAIASMTLWSMSVRGAPLAAWIETRNPFPLGHSNYTAGLAVLMLPGLLGFAWVARGRSRVVALLGAALAVMLLLTSASRAAILALLALAFLGVACGTLTRRTKLRLLVLALGGTAVITALHPRTRALLQPADISLPPNPSNVQRTAMLRAAAKMGADRPLLGWGLGTTPLVYPRYRGQLDGGAQNVLQLHSTPAQLWAELGLVGLIGATIIVVGFVRAAPRDRLAALTLGGYAVFSIFDWQLDVPIFAAAIAALAALLSPPPPGVAVSTARATTIGILTLAVFAVVAIAGGRDPTPELNVRALHAGTDPRQADRAAELFRASLARNPHQEIAHFNLGWLLVASDPTNAERHFHAAAHLVPDKGGVYFGLALARLNQGNTPGAVHALALEGLNDPVFLTSPWWTVPEVAALREATLTRLLQFHDHAAAALPPASWAARENRYARTFAAWIAHRADATRVSSVATTPERRAYFQDPAHAQPLGLARAISLRRERVGYPVLMRNLDLPVPLDLFEVRDSAYRDGPLGFLFPAKGWLPSRLLVALLERPVFDNP